MKIIQVIGQWLSPRKRLLNQLAEIAANAETLAGNLARHKEMCGYPTLRAGVAEVAAAEMGQANAMRQLLLQYGMGPKLPRMPAHEGSSNWERLQNDLALQVRILRSLHTQLPQWTGIDPLLAERLREAATQEERLIERLRDLTLKCDPQALD